LSNCHANNFLSFYFNRLDKKTFFEALHHDYFLFPACQFVTFFVTYLFYLFTMSFSPTELF